MRACWPRSTATRTTNYFKLRLITDYTVTGIDADQATRSLRQAEALVIEMRRLLDAT